MYKKLKSIKGIDLRNRKSCKCQNTYKRKKYKKKRATKENRKIMFSVLLHGALLDIILYHIGPCPYTDITKHLKDADWVKS